jgi:hypothetical protein
MSASSDDRREEVDQRDADQEQRRPEDVEDRVIHGAQDDRGPGGTSNSLALRISPELPGPAADDDADRWDPQDVSSGRVPDRHARPSDLTKT